MSGVLDALIDRYPDDEFLLADGFDDAIIGVEPDSMRLVYSCSKCIEVLQKTGMSYDEAEEHFSFNVRGSYVGEKTPIWVEDDFETEESESIW